MCQMLTKWQQKKKQIKIEQIKLNVNILKDIENVFLWRKFVKKKKN